MKPTFEENLERLGMKPFEVKFNVTEDVYNELHNMADDNDCSLADFMRDMVDFFMIEWHSE